MIFSKPPRTPEYLARKLIQNGLQGITELELTEIFQSINYYKLRGYTYPYQDNSVPGSPFLQSIKWSSIMKPQLPEKEAICNYFGFEKIQADKLASWFQNINIVRNICAHHGRLFSRHLTTAPYFMTPQKGSWVSNWPNPCRIYASICIIQSLLNICYKENTFATELKELMKMVRKEQLPTMGFPQNWQNEDLFNLK